MNLVKAGLFIETRVVNNNNNSLWRSLAGVGWGRYTNIITDLLKHETTTTDSTAICHSLTHVCECESVWVCESARAHWRKRDNTRPWKKRMFDYCKGVNEGCSLLWSKSWNDLFKLVTSVFIRIWLIIQSTKKKKRKCKWKSFGGSLSVSAGLLSQYICTKSTTVCMSHSHPPSPAFTQLSFVPEQRQTTPVSCRTCLFLIAKGMSQHSLLSICRWRPRNNNTLTSNIYSYKYKTLLIIPVGNAHHPVYNSRFSHTLVPELKTLMNYSLMYFRCVHVTAVHPLLTVLYSHN